VPFFGVLPPATFDAAVPTINSVLGYGWGQEISDSEQVLRMAHALADAAPSRVRLVQYASSLEGRPLVLLIVGSPANLAKWDDIQGRLEALGDPRTFPASGVQEATRTLPAVVWIQCTVHGDETSGSDAGLALGYYLAAGRSAEIDAILARTFVVIDPVENPDGRARFVAATRRARGSHPDAEPVSAEHVQQWPGGRFSHALFDLNRDWFALTQPETRGRVNAMLAGHPTVAADLHEMGPEEGYYFAPPAPPRNPLLESESGLLDLLGRANAAAFDAHGFRYWTREIFDEFYPGYGDSWPALTGAVGMTFEQASPRGLLMKLEDGTILTYGEAVQHHLLAAYTTCVTTASNAARFLHAWYAYRLAAVTDGQQGAVRAYLLSDGASELRSYGMAEQLARQGIETFRVAKGGEGVPAGTYVVPLDQPLGRMARALLERGESMGETFEKRQEERDRKRLPDEIYDLTAWSLPLLWNISAKPLPSLPKGLDLERVVAGKGPEGTVLGEGRVAFLLPWDGPAAAKALARVLEAGIKAGVATKPFTLGDLDFARGTVVIRTVGNGESLRDRLLGVARTTGVTFVGADTGYADHGIDLGSTSVVALKAPRVALLWDWPTSPSSAGDLRYALETWFGYPVTVVRTGALAHADLSHFDVIILPDTSEHGGSYGGMLGEPAVKRLRAWVDEGGVLIGVGGGAEFLTGEKVSLLASKLENRLGSETHEEKGKPAAKLEAAPPGRAVDYESAIRPTADQPPVVPGAILRVTLDTENPLASGFPGGAVDALIYSRRVFAPLKLDKGVNVGVFADGAQLVDSGFVFPDSRQQLPHAPYLMLQPEGRGKVVAFADDPAARGLTHATMMLLANAVFFGPAY
jgi:Zinc carboxypeptidase